VSTDVPAGRLCVSQCQFPFSSAGWLAQTGTPVTETVISSPAGAVPWIGGLLGPMVDWSAGV
jgi:hypothetical protein